MSKTYAKSTIQERDFTDALIYNKEASGVLAEFNGNLSQDQLPYEVLEKENFVANSRISVDSQPDGSASNGIGIIMPTQAIYKAASALTTFTWDRLLPSGSGPVSVLGPPIAAYTSTTSSWTSGINSLSDDIALGTFLRFTSRKALLEALPQLTLSIIL